MNSSKKLVTVAQKSTKIKSRVPKSQAEMLVSILGTHHFVRKGAFKRQEKDLAKALNRAKKRSIFGAKIVREYYERKPQQMSVPS